MRPRSIATAAVFLVSGTVAALLVASRFTRPALAQPPAASRAQPVETTVARAETVQVILESVGTARAAEQTLLTAQATGVVTEIHFDDGQNVRAGELLVALDHDEQEASVNLAKVVRDGAQRDLNRAMALATQNAVPREQVDDLRTSYESAEARLQTAQAQLEKRFIRAPFSGRLGLRQISLGALVTPGTQITYLQSNDPVEIVFTVPEGSVSDVHLGQVVRAYRAGARSSVISARVTSVDSRVDPATRAVTVIARSTSDGRIVKPGMFVNVELVVGQRRSVALPEEAVYLEGARTYAFVVREGSARRQEVRVGQRSDGQVEILDGVVPGDVVIVSGIQKVRDGAPVQPMGAGAGQAVGRPTGAPGRGR